MIQIALAGTFVIDTKEGIYIFVSCSSFRERRLQNDEDCEGEAVVLLKLY